MYNLITNTDNQWNSVLDKPLYVKDVQGYWTCTSDGDNKLGFFAAVETNQGWWIRHCIVEDGIGLCVVGSDYNEPAPWGIGDVTYWINIPFFPLSCKHKNMTRSDGLDKCLDCGARNY